jgi:hypothetical protein
MLAWPALLAAYLAVAVGGGPVADGARDEGSATSITGRVERVGAESDGRVPVAILPYAQMYFLHRSDPGFDALLPLLKDALSSQRAVRCTFRRFSGRIVSVEWADPDDRGEAARWTGTAQVDVMMWEPGGEHPYATAFDLAYREVGRAPILDANGGVRGYQLRLVPERVAIDVRHEVRHVDGRSICKGGGREDVTGAPEGRIVRAAWGAALPGLDASTASAYQLVLPRAVGAFACGTTRNVRDRRVVIGSRLFDAVDPAAEIETTDASVRSLDPGGLVMKGVYQSSDAATGRTVRHDYTVRWELRRVQE